MKRFIFLIIAGLLVITSCGSKYNDLFTITDDFVESLQTTYSSYGLIGGLDEIKHTPDGSYQILPVGRLINVRIERPASGEDYETLRKALEKHYAKDNRVVSVYRCQAGTLMIDCRK